MSTAPAAAGSLATKPFAHLLVYALEKELTGTFELSDPDSAEAASFVVISGLIAKIRTSVQAAYLGDVLCEQGLLAEENLRVSLASLTAENGPLGQFLLTNQLITKEQLEAALREQALRKLGHVFAYGPAATFAFHEGVDRLASYGGGEPVLADPFPAIWRGLRDFPPEDHVKDVLLRTSQLRCRLSRAARIERFAFEKEELGLIESLRSGDASLADLEATNFLPKRLTDLLFYCLLITKQVEVVNAAEAPGSPRRPPSRAPAPSVAPGVPSAAPSVRPPTEPSAREKAIFERAKSIHKEDHFHRLSVARDAPTETIDQAFAAVGRMWDGSALAPHLHAAREACAVVHAALVEAHETLRDPQKRADYEKKLLLGLAHQPTPAEDLAASGAANEFDGARACLAKGDLERAERLARRAQRAKPDQGPQIALLAWIEAQKATLQSVDATRARIMMLSRAIRLEPECEEAFLYRALLYKRLGNYGPAVRDLRQLLEMNPDHAEATRELRTCEELAEDAPPKSTRKAGGFLDRFLKK